MASTYIAVLLVPDEAASVELLRYYLQSLNHDLLVCRKVSQDFAQSEFPQISDKFPVPD